MPTDSITKDFIIHDQRAFDNLVKQLETSTEPHKPYHSSKLEYSKQKLQKFVFAEDIKKG